MAPVDSSSAGKTILVVEDHTDTAEMLALILQSEGYQVRTAASARAAYDVLSAEAASIGLVLLDLTLPDMDGDDVIRRLRDNHIKVPPILIMSAQHAGSLDNARHRIGAAGVIRKPFDIQVLLESIQSELERE